MNPWDRKLFQIHNKTRIWSGWHFLIDHHASKTEDGSDKGETGDWETIAGVSARMMRTWP